MWKSIRSIFRWIYELFRTCPKAVRRASSDEQFLVIAHRGSPTVKVENTIESFEHAIEIDGANALELDLCMTRDGVLVIWHDWDPDSMDGLLREKGMEPEVKHRPRPPVDGDFRKPVSSLTFDEFIRNYDYALKDGDGSPVGAHIPTFHEFVRWAATKPQIQKVFLDTKIPDEEAGLVPRYMHCVEEAMARYEPSFRIVFETVQCDVLRAMKEYRPNYDYTLDVALHPGFVFDIEGASCAKQAIEQRNRYGTPERPRQDTVAPWMTYRRLVEHDLKLCEGHNRNNPDDCVEAIVCYTIDDAREMRCLIGMGVQGIVSDRPGLLRSVAENMGRKVGGTGPRSNSGRDGSDGSASHHRESERPAVRR